jgi:hypothetical protein
MITRVQPRADVRGQTFYFARAGGSLAEGVECPLDVRSGRLLLRRPIR